MTAKKAKYYTEVAKGVYEQRHFETSIDQVVDDKTGESLDSKLKRVDQAVENVASSTANEFSNRFKDVKLNSGVEVQRSGASNAKLVFDETVDKWKMDKGDGNLVGVASEEEVYQQLADLAVNVANFPRLVNETDDTLRLQRAIDALKDGDTLLIPPAEYTVKKNQSLLSYPNGDQPCLLLKGKRDVKVSAMGAILRVNEHAQGILEVDSCENIVIEGLSVQGLGTFVPLDGNTGRGEKGYATGGGYDTVSFWGFHKNNSYDTSSNLKNGTPWGKFEGGFIGNSAFGLLIIGSKNVTLNNCTSQGFNYAGFGVGFWGYEKAKSQCHNVTLNKCIATDNYQANIYVTDCVGCVVNDCISERAGHPDAQPLTDSVADPGYGYMATGITNRIPYQLIVKDSIFKDCVRKGIDFHAGQNIHVLDNLVENCYACGIFAAYSSASQYTRDIFIERNTVVRCGIQSLGSIYVSGLIDGGYSRENIVLNAQILNNVIKEFGYRALNCPTFDNIRFEGNLIDGHDSRDTGTPRALILGKLQAGQPSYNGIFTKNTIKGSFVSAIYVGELSGGVISENQIELHSTVENATIYAALATEFDCFRNVISTDAGNAFSLALNLGTVKDNIVKKETIRSVGTEKTSLGKREIVVLTANGVNYNMTKRLDAGIVSTLSNVSVAEGLLLTLSTAVPTGAIPRVTLNGGGTMMNDGTNFIVAPQVVTTTSNEIRIKLLSATGTSHALNSLQSGSLLVDITI